MTRALVITAIVAALAAPASFAVAPATDLYLPSVGHAQGACPGGVCSQWRTDVWIYNPATTGSVTVTVSFLRRDTENTSPATQAVVVAAGEVKELADIIATTFGLDGVYGALRFTAASEVVVTGRIYDANVQTNKGTGTAGQFFAGLPATLAIGNGEKTTIIGLAQDSGSVWRTNFGFVETSGASATVEVKRLDGVGTVLATKSYNLRARESRQFAITDIGGALGTNQQLLATVTGGSGRVIAFASRLDNRTGDPSTVEMVTKVVSTAKNSGRFDGVVLTSDALLIDGGIELDIDSSGVTGFAGVSGLPCGADNYVVDFSTTSATPIPIGGDGSFVGSVSIEYKEGSTVFFTINWTLSGALTDGVLSGTLRSVTSGGAGSWAACNGTVDRPWRAGWTSD